MSAIPPLKMRIGALFVLGAAVCFHLAYSTPFGFFIFGYIACLVQLARMRTGRLAFYLGLLAGLLCFAPQLEFFWRIFGQAALVLWVILALWIGLFTVLMNVAFVRFGAVRAALLAPFLWTGIEYFRSELYYLRFSWMNVGYALSNSRIPFNSLGAYGVGFVATSFGALILARRFKFLPLALVALLGCEALLLSFRGAPPQSQVLRVAGVQMEFPSVDEVVLNLDKLVAQFPDAQVLVLSEYTLDGPPPEKLKGWCRGNRKYLVVGGKDPVSNDAYYNTAFVVGPDGDVVFKQAKAVPIQFFSDGLPAREQKVWDSPWGKIGICICYDLSYTRVTDELIRLGAQALIVPTMDVEGWGRHQHELHERVALVRAAEYGVPIFRIASSGISQCVNRFGGEESTAPFAGDGAMISGEVKMGHPGRLPADRVLVALSLAITAAFVGWVAIDKGLGLFRRG